MRKLRVFYVDDPGEEKPDLDLIEYRQSMEKEFWREASELCPDHKVDRSEQCKNCIFELSFFAYFPEALYDLLEARPYDAYLVDIWPSPSPLNQWDDDQYKPRADKYKERLERLFPELEANWPINGKDHIIPLISKLAHDIRPYVVWMSAVYKAKEAMATDNLSMVSGKETPIRWLLLGAYKWLKPQLIEKLTVPIPTEPELSINQPVLLDFAKGQFSVATRVSLEADDHYITNGLPAELGEQVTWKLAGGLTRGVPLRHLARGGRFEKTEKNLCQVNLGRMIEPFNKEAEAHDTLLSKYPDLKKIEEAFKEKVDTKTNAKYTFWNAKKGLKVVTTTDLAWRYLYHAVVRLYIHTSAKGEDISAFIKTKLAQDASQFESLDALLIAREFADRAEAIGSDKFGKVIGDLELSWVPKVVSLAIDAEQEQSDVDFVSRAQQLRKVPRNTIKEILEEEDERDRLRREFMFYGWLGARGLRHIQRCLRDIERQEKSPRELKSVLFGIYANGENMYGQFKGQVRPRLG